MSEQDVKFKPELLSTIGWDSDSDDDRPLTCFVSDRVQLMRKIFKRISSKRMVQMAPKCLKEMPISQMKSVLLDELMGISNKRLTSIINNTNDRTRSSSSSDEEPVPVQKPDDVISLDDISDDSSVGIIDDVNCMEIKLSERERFEMDAECIQGKHKRKHKKNKIKHNKKNKITVKEEKLDELTIKDESTDNEPPEAEPVKPDDPFVSALNLLELQARARAIRSQLLNEIIVDDSIPVPQNTEDNPVKSEPNSPNSVVILSPERDVVEIDESSHGSHDESKIDEDPTTEQNGVEPLSEDKIEEPGRDEVDKSSNGLDVTNEDVLPKADNDNQENNKNNVNTEIYSVADDDVLIMNEDDDILI